MKTLFKKLSCALFVLTLIATTSGAHEIFAPSVVGADGGGRFAYNVYVVVTEPIEFAYSTLTNLENTDIAEYHADGFCTTVVEPGTYKVPIEGILVDLTQDGRIQYQHAMCDGWNGEVTTRLVAPAVDAAPTSWSALKTWYR